MPLIPKSLVETNMKSETETYETITSLENANRHLLENQAFLHEENEKLQKELARTQLEVQKLTKSSVDASVLETLKQERNNLSILNNNLKQKIKYLNTPPPNLTTSEIENERRAKESLSTAIEDLELVLGKIEDKSERVVMRQKSDEVTEVLNLLTNEIQNEEKKTEVAMEALRKSRDDDEKFMLKEKITDMKQLITDLEVENTKLKLESERLAEEVNIFKRKLDKSDEETLSITKQVKQLEDEKEKLKQIISNIENDNIRLKKEMIDEMNEANRARRVSIDTELALQHVSEAYELKRQEVMVYIKQLDEAKGTIRNLRSQPSNLEI